MRERLSLKILVILPEIIIEKAEPDVWRRGCFLEYLRVSIFHLSALQKL
jgi:hypothetical protein